MQRGKPQPSFAIDMTIFDDNRLKLCSFPFTVTRCEPLKRILGGTTNCSYNNTLIESNVVYNGPLLNGTQCVFACSTNFDLIGLNSLTCNESEWNGTQPKCKMKRKLFFTTN